MKILKTLPLILLVALVGCKSNGNTDTKAPVSSTVTERDSSSLYSGIVYVNTDSLLSKYNMAKELTEAFSVKAEKSQKQFQAKQRAFETSVNDYQNKISKGLVTRTEAMTIEDKLKKDEQVLMNYGRTMEAELQEEQAVLMNKISYAVKEYMDKFNQSKKYSLVINTNSMSTVILTSDPALDITNEVLEGINKEYEATKAKK